VKLRAALLAASLSVLCPNSARAQSHEHPAPERPEKHPHIPPVTDDDRAAAFPPHVEGHAVHDQAVSYFVLIDQFEWQGGGDGSAIDWDTKGWIGGDVNRFWFRTEGKEEDGLEQAQAHFLYGRAISPWWDLVLGVRQDFRPGPPQTWAAVGFRGLAPYWIEVEATAYVGEAGRTHFRFETEYELLLTNRLVLQPLVEMEIYGKSDPEHEMGAGLSTLDAGIRIRYEIRREIAPYVGVAWREKFGETADLAEAAGKETGSTQAAFGVRLWF
jgi:copper resistance protein B